MASRITVPDAGLGALPSVRDLRWRDADVSIALPSPGAKPRPVSRWSIDAPDPRTLAWRIPPRQRLLAPLRTMHRTQRGFEGSCLRKYR